MTNPNQDDNLSPKKRSDDDGTGYGAYDEEDGDPLVPEEDFDEDEFGDDEEEEGFDKEDNV